MAGGSNRGMLMLALLAGLIAAALVFIAINAAGDDDSSSPTSVGDTTGVVVAAVDVNAGTRLTADMLRVADVPADLVIAGSFNESDLLVGQIAGVSLTAGEQVTGAKIGPVAVDDDAGLGYVVADGKRAVGLTISAASAAGGLLLPGDRVDVLAAYTIDVADSEDSISVRTVLQDVEVLSVAQEAQLPRPARPAEGAQAPTVATSGEIPDDAEIQPDASTVTLSVDPVQAQVLVGVQQSATAIWLAQRAASDQLPIDLAPITVDSSGVR
jgi:pilus assembly protein CpaB